MKQEVKLGQTDYTIFILVRDTSGNAKTGLTNASAGLDVSYARVETDNDVTVTAGAPVALATPALTDQHLDWGFLEVDATNHPGLYRLDIADGAFAAGAWSSVVTLIGTGLEPSHCEFMLIPAAPIDGVSVNTFTAGAITATAIAAAAIDNATFAADVHSTAYATNIIALAVRKALDEIKLDHLVAVADADDVVDNSIIAKLAALGATADWSTFVNTTDSLQALRDQGDSAWITAAGFAVAGDAMNLAADAIKAVSYDESTAWPLTASDAGATQIARVGADGDTLETISDEIAALNDFDPANDDVAVVTLVGTTTTNSDLVTAAAIKTAMEADGGDLSSIMEALVNKLLITEASGNTDMHNDAGVFQGTVVAAFTSVAGVTQRKRMVV